MAQYTDEYGRTFQAHVTSSGQVIYGGQVIGQADPITQRYISAPQGYQSPVSAIGYVRSRADEIANLRGMNEEQRARFGATGRLEMLLDQEQRANQQVMATAQQQAQVQPEPAQKTVQASMVKAAPSNKGYTEEEARQFSIAATGTPANAAYYTGRQNPMYGKLTGESGPGLPRTPTSTPLRAAGGKVTGTQIATAQKRLEAERGYLEQRRGAVSEASEVEQFNKQVEQYNLNAAAYGALAGEYNLQAQMKFNASLEEAGYTYSPAPLPYTPKGGGYEFAPMSIKTEPAYTPAQGGFASMASGETALITYGTPEEIGKASFERPAMLFAKTGILPKDTYVIEPKRTEGRAIEVYSLQGQLIDTAEFGLIRAPQEKQTLQQQITGNVYEIGATAEKADWFRALPNAFDYSIATEKNEWLRGGLQGAKGVFTLITPSFYVQAGTAIVGTGAIVGADILTGDYATTKQGFKRAAAGFSAQFETPEALAGTLVMGIGSLGIGAIGPTAKGTLARYARGAEPEILLTPKGTRPNIYEGTLGETGFVKSKFAPSEGFAGETQTFGIQAQQKIKPFFGQPTEIYVKGIAEVTARTGKTDIIFETPKGYNIFEGSIGKVSGTQEAFITRMGQEVTGRTPRTISTLEVGELTRQPPIISERGIRMQVPKQRAVELETGAQIRFSEPKIPDYFVQQFRAYYELPEGGFGRAKVYLAERGAQRPATAEIPNMFEGTGKQRIREDFGVRSMFDMPERKYTPFKFEEPKQKNIEYPTQKQVQIKKTRSELIKATTKQTTQKLKQAYAEYTEEAYRGKPLSFRMAIKTMGVTAFTSRQREQPLEIYKSLQRELEIQSPLQIQREMLSPMTMQTLRQSPLQIQRPSQISIQRQTPLERMALKQIEIQRPVQFQQQLIRTGFEPLRPGQPLIPPYRPVPFVPWLPGGLPSLGYSEGGRAREGTRGRKFKYSPSLIAISLGITAKGKRPKESYITTGEIRPIYIGTTKRRRRK